MDLKQYLRGIEIPATNEVQINDFLSKKENEIMSFIQKTWTDYLVVSNVNSIEKAALTEDKTQVDQSTETFIPIVETIEQPIQPSTTSQSVSKEELNELKKVETFTNTLRNKYITLQNGKVNQPYSFIFDVKQLGIPDIEDFWIIGLEEIGLAFISDNNEIKGVPIKAGEHKIKLEVKYKGTEGRPPIPKEISLIINPDPRSLWNNIPTPEKIDYYKPDCNKQYIKVKPSGFIVKTEHKDIIVASQRGRSHAHEGKARDDDFGILYDDKTEWYILSVADGAGSALFSRKGSEIACKTVVEVCQKNINDQLKELERLIKEYNVDRSEGNRKKLGDVIYNIVGTSVFKAYKNIGEEAKTANRSIKDFSTTLIVTITKKFKFGWFVAAFWVGDGGVGIYDKESQFINVLGETDGGEFAGQTRFLTMPEITQPNELYRRLRFDIVKDFTALILMTDGITDPKFETDSNLLKVEQWNELWEDLSKEVSFTDDNEKSADQLLKWLDFWSPGNHDDRTIAILY